MLTSRAVAMALAALLPAILAAPAAEAIQTRVVPQSINEFVYNASDGFLYASVPSSAPSYGNNVIRVNVVTGAIVASVAVGSEPRDLALADDGRTLYVGLDGAAAIRRVDVSTMTAGAQFSLGTDPYTGPYYAEDIEVMPGNPNVVAVSLRNSGFSPRHEGVAIFDNGVARPTRTPDHTGSNVIEFGASATRVYGYNNETTEFGFRRMSVTSSGITVLESTPNLIGSFGTDIRYFGGRVYATTGEVIDPESRTLLGTFSFPDYSYGRAVAPGADRVYYATGDYGYGSSTKLNIFDPATFAVITRYSIPSVTGVPFRAFSLHRLSLRHLQPRLLLRLAGRRRLPVRAGRGG
jgi:hypothetical protein